MLYNINIICNVIIIWNIIICNVRYGGYGDLSQAEHWNYPWLGLGALVGLVSSLGHCLRYVLGCVLMAGDTWN